MEDLKRLLKVVEESKVKREKEYVSKCVQQLEKNGRLFDTLNSCDIFELGKLKGRIEEKTELAAALKRMIKRKEEQTKTDVEFEQALKEIEDVMSILPFLELFCILENKK